ncbi:DNA repair protein RecO [Rhodobacterales bacterium 52_120_T64]|nr:DNA repair protein RecO [Rhodobacterales bacterium 52_120_T64]
MDWRDEGVLLSVRKHGEGSAIIEVFTKEHGRHAGLVRGGGSRKMSPILQPGAQLSVEWKARLEDHLGSYTIDPIKSRAVSIMGDRGSLAAMGSISAFLCLGLPEREAHQQLYARTLDLVDALGETDDWPARYALWENALLTEMGFGLDLTECAATGATQELIYVSPKSGRAVSRTGGADYADLLLSLPRFLRMDEPMTQGTDVTDSLNITGHFLKKWLMPALGRDKIPSARERLISALQRTNS